MPAVQLARLKAQLGQLAWQFTRPSELHHTLNELFEYYADRVYRPGSTILARMSILSYRLPPLVLREAEIELLRLCQENPHAALLLADDLWNDKYLEPRLLAAALLGQAPLTPPEPVIERLHDWARPAEDDRVLAALFEKGSLRLRRESPHHWLEPIEGWIKDENPAYQIMGLQAMLPLIEDEQFTNLPPVFDMVIRILRIQDVRPPVELITVMQKLAQRSPEETVFVLRQTVMLGAGGEIVRLIRKVIPTLPAKYQASLRAVIRSAGAS